MNQELGEIGGVFVSKQPSDTDMGAKEPKTDGWEQKDGRNKQAWQPCFLHWSCVKMNVENSRVADVCGVKSFVLLQRFTQV